MAIATAWRALRPLLEKGIRNSSQVKAAVGEMSEGWRDATRRAEKAEAERDEEKASAERAWVAWEVEQKEAEKYSGVVFFTQYQAAMVRVEFAELRKAAKALVEADSATADTCIVCAASLVPEGAPHCEGCFVEAEHETEWEERKEARAAAFVALQALLEKGGA